MCAWAASAPSSGVFTVSQISARGGEQIFASWLDIVQLIHAAWRYYSVLPRPVSEEMMKPHLLVLLFAAATPAWGQGQLPLNAKPSVKGVARVDNCAPIGRTANGELVYSMKCDNMPVPVPPPQAKVEEPAPPPPPSRSDEGRSGLFGWSFDRRQSDQ